VRICTRCNRPLRDEAYHDTVEYGVAAPPIVGWYQGHPVYDVPEGDLKPRFRQYVCKMRLVATSPVSGKTLVPNSPQRITETDTRYVHEARFEGDLKP